MVSRAAAQQSSGARPRGMDAILRDAASSPWALLGGMAIFLYVGAEVAIGTQMALLLVACDFIARALPGWEPDPNRGMLMGIVYFGIPTIVLAFLALVGREGKRAEWKQWHYALGVPLVAALGKVMFFA